MGFETIEDAQDEKHSICRPLFFEKVYFRKLNIDEECSIKVYWEPDEDGEYEYNYIKIVGRFGALNWLEDLLELWAIAWDRNNLF